MSNLKLRWLSKLARAEHFIVVTDEEAVIRLHLSPDFDNVMLVTSQRAELENFRGYLNETIEKLDESIDKQFEVPKQRKKNKTTTKKG